MRGRENLFSTFKSNYFKHHHNLSNTKTIIFMFCSSNRDLPATTKDCIKRAQTLLFSLRSNCSASHWGSNNMLDKQQQLNLFMKIQVHLFFSFPVNSSPVLCLQSIIWALLCTQPVLFHNSSFEIVSGHLTLKIGICLRRRISMWFVFDWKFLKEV